MTKHSMPPPTHAAAHVANYFLDRQRPRQPLLLHEMVILTHGQNLAIHERPLIIEAVRTGPYGAVIIPLFKLLAAHCSNKPLKKHLPENRCKNG